MPKLAIPHCSSRYEMIVPNGATFRIKGLRITGYGKGTATLGVGEQDLVTATSTQWHDGLDPAVTVPERQNIYVKVVGDQPTRVDLILASEPDEPL
jgi:hypothetical protein